VRGATLRDGPGTAVRVATPPADPDEVRSALEEFEAAVSRAERDSSPTGSTDSTAGSTTGLSTTTSTTSTTSTPERTEGVGQ
jgi:hypothetical protein